MNNWNQYEKLVLDKLDILTSKVDKIEDKFITIKIELAKLKIKAGVWGLMAGLIPAVLALSLYLLIGGY